MSDLAPEPAPAEFYCPGCGARYQTPGVCTGSVEGPHEPIAVTAVDGDVAPTTPAAPAGPATPATPAEPATPATPAEPAVPTQPASRATPAVPAPPATLEERVAQLEAAVFSGTPKAGEPAGGWPA